MTVSTCGATIPFLVCRGPRAVMLERLAERLRRQEDISDARPEFYDLHEKELHAAEDLFGKEVVTLNSTAPTVHGVATVLEQLRHTGS